MKLTVNMRLGSGSNSSERKEIQDFADWILNIENGKIGGKNDGEANVEFHDDMLIMDSDDHIGSIIHETYLDLLHNIYDPDYFQERAILAPTHELVDMINDKMLSLIHGDEKTYNSSDTVGVADVDTNFNETMYTKEFLNNLNMAVIPHHSIKLKIGRVNERQTQTTMEKVDTSKELDASSIIIKSNGTESQEQDTSSRSRNDAHVDDADNNPYNDEDQS
ncbi:ATP-dependent DNA helicase PIF1-like protein [Tanacetum coccineum]|uniref:ATP-dependent DNA helicase n=1 Tax=Tanacetum coccineum TaxID=301880 RepID=A0ABQ5AJK9_9ASTR